MASRALARLRALARRLRARLRPRAVAGARAGDPALARRDVRSRARRLLGRTRDHDRARWTSALERHRGQRGEGRRHQGLAARRRARRSRCAAGCPRGVRMYTGDDFNFAELIGAMRRATPTRCSASSTRSRRRRPRRSPRSPRATARASTRILAPTVPLSRHIFAAPTRFYKTGVVFMAWLNGHQSHFTMVGGQQSARSVAAPRASCSGWPMRRACCAIRTLAASRMRTFLGDARHRRVMAEPRSTGLLSLNTATVRAQWDAAARSSTGCARHGIRGISPWRDQVAAAGLKETRRAHPRRRASRCPATAAAACSRRSTARAGAPRSTTTSARSTKRSTLGAPCLVLVVGGLPKDRDGTIRVEGPGAARARWCATASASCSSTRGRPACRSRSSRCIRCTRPTAPASTRWRRRSTCATSSGAGARRRGRRLPRVVGPAARARDRARRRRTPSRLLAYHICDWLVPTTDLLNDRGMMGDGVIDLPLICARGWKPRATAACTRSRSSRPTTGGSAIRTRCSRRARRGIAIARSDDGRGVA